MISLHTKPKKAVLHQSQKLDDQKDLDLREASEKFKSWTELIRSFQRKKNRSNERLASLLNACRS